MDTATLKPFERDLADTLLSIEMCIEKRRHMPTKILIYSLMDSMAWACSAKTRSSSRNVFEAWVGRWMLPRLASVASAIRPVDLYAARCAVLHTMTPDSQLSREGTAQTIAYAWGSGDVKTLEAVLNELGATSIVAIHYDDLLHALRQAIADCLDASDTDEGLRQNLEAAAKQHYAYVPVPQSAA